jgi:DNA-binding NarL/FixJ family response regulator
MLMPGKEGAATIIEIREARPEARILAISGGGSFVATEILRLAEPVGADAAIQKPFSTAELLAAIDRCLVTESAAAPTTPP